MHEGVRKLKLERFDRVGIKSLPPEINAFHDQQVDTTMENPPYDCVITTVFNLEEMAYEITWAFQGQVLTSNGVMYMLYPKKGNRKYSQFIHRDSIFELGIDSDGFFGGTDLKLNTMLAFDEVFTVCGVKRILSKVYRKPNVSQSVNDYRDRVEELRTHVSPDVLPSFHALAPGYQVAWARYVFSAVQEATRRRRIVDMNQAFEKGYRSPEQYQRNKDTEEIR